MKMPFKFMTAMLATLVLAACGNQMEPAQKALSEIESTVQAASADAVKYVPNEVETVNARLTELKAAFDKKDYKTVIAGAPALLADAKKLATDAAAKKEEYVKMLGDEWTKMSAALPQAVTAIESRVAQLKKMKKLPDGISKDTIAAAGTGLDEAKATWTQATAAFGEGKVEEAVTKAKAVKGKVDELMSSLGIAPAAA
jgi:hypothetical protein